MLKIAHRGASGHILENTKKSFKKALKLNTEGVEFDVRLTKDKRIVVVHDEDLKRVANNSDLVKDLTLRQIRKIKQKDGEDILTLKEALKILNHSCVYKIHLKEKGMEEKVIKFIEQRHLEKRIIITTDFFSVARKVKNICPNLKVELGGIRKRIKAEKIIRRAKNAKADFISPHHSIITEKLVQEAHKSGLFIDAWEVNEKKDIAKMKRMGVDAITTDYPDRL